MANELNINMDEYICTCSSEEMQKNLTRETIENSPLQRRYEETDYKLELLKQSENPELATAERAYLMSEQVRIRKELNQEKSKIEAIIEKNKTLLTKLYNLREAFLNDGKSLAEKADDREGSKVKSAEITFDSNGNPSLEVKMADAIGFDFKIHDGKVILPSNLSDEQLLEALDFLYRRGISYELPNSEKGTTFEEVYKRVEEKRNADPETHKPDINKTKEEDWSGIEPYYGTPNAENVNGSEGAAAAGNTIPSATGTPSYITKPEEKKKSEGFKAAFEKMTGFLEKEQNKRKDLSYFVDGDAGSSQVVFNVYNNENDQNLKKDGKKDKDGAYKETCAYRVRLTQKDGNLSKIEFHVPNGGKMPDGLADKVAEIVKGQGALYLNCPKGLSPADAREIRNSCARFGILPKGINVSEKHAAKMIQEAENALSDKDLVKYKGLLGQHLLELAKGDPNDRRYNMAISLINQEKYTPFKDCFDNLIKPDIEKKGRETTADVVIGSARAAEQLYLLYKENTATSFETLANSNILDDQTKQAFLQNLQNANIVPDSGTSMKEMSQEQLKALFDALTIKQTAEAKEELTRDVNAENNKHDKVEAVRNAVSDARNALSNIVSDLEANGLKGSRAPYLGNPKFNPAPNNTMSLGNAARGGAEI